jgi:hypothetical protein
MFEDEVSSLRREFSNDGQSHVRSRKEEEVSQCGERLEAPTRSEDYESLYHQSGDTIVPTFKLSLIEI